jgi:hypothetical protein
VEKAAIVVCAPDGEERYWSQRTMVNASRFLAAHGYSVLRFDYAGQGESEGDYEDKSVSSRLRNIEDAVREIRLLATTKNVGVLGVRLGATLALMTKLDPICRFVLWEPVFDISTYVDGLLRINISTQTVVNKKVDRNREQLKSDILSGGTVSINGYNLGKAFFEELASYDIPEYFSNCTTKRLIITSRATKMETDPACDIQIAKFSHFWKEPRIYQTLPMDIFSSTLNWLNNHS